MGAAMVTETEQVAVESLIPEYRTGPGRKWKPGQSGNPNGRPRKGESVMDQTKRLAATKSKQLAEAHVKRMMRTDSVGNRAWSDFNAYDVGLPKQTYVIEQADSPLLAFLTKHVDVVEGESRLLPESQGE